MLTTIEQVREWIKDNGFKRWVLYRDYGRTEKILDSAGLAVADMPDKIAMTEKYLRLAGGRAYAAGATTNAANDLTTICEIQLTEAAAPANGVGYVQPLIDEDKIAARIEAKIRAEYERKEYERLRKELDADRKRLEDEKASAMGALAHYFAPIGQAILGGQRRMVAGVDAEEPVHAQQIIPEEEHAEEQEQEQSPFTDEEADKLFGLMARFKKVEPDYLKLITRVVEMAESGDGTYTMAKGFLLK